MSTSFEHLADGNFVEAVRAHARWQIPCDFVESDGMLRVAGANALPIGFRNCVLRTDESLDPVAFVNNALTFFDKRERGFSVMLRASHDADIDAYLQRLGWSAGPDVPCLLVDKPLSGFHSLPGIVVQRITERSHQADAVAVNAEAYQTLKLPAEETRRYFGNPDALLGSDVEGFVAYRDGLPVATAFALINGDAAGVYWVGSVSEARGLGLGELCTRLATNAGFSRGARVVTLQASPLGLPIYSRMGFRVYDQYRAYRASQA